MKNPTQINADSCDLLGYVITWDMAGSHSVSAIRDALRSAGLDEDLCKDLLLAQAFKRALRQLDKESLIDQVSRVDDKVHFQMTGRQIINEELMFHRQAVLVLDLSTGDITSGDGLPNEKMVGEARMLLDSAMEQRTGCDISRYIQRLFESNADMFPLNPKKGVTYFVPIEHFLLLEKIGNFVKDLGGTLPCWPVPVGTERGNASVKSAVESGLTTMAAELEAALSSWGKTTREDTKKRMWAKVEKLEFKLRAYSGYLQDRSGAAHNAVVELRRSILDKVKAIEEAEEVIANC